MPYAENDGVHIYYRVVGEGPPLVLQHGFGQNLKAWYLFGYVEALRRQFRLVLIDARGHGDSDKLYDPGAYELSLQVADVVAVLDQLKITKAAFWGYSSGGRVGLGLAKWAPERVSAIVIGGQDAGARRVPASVKIDPADPEGSLDRIYATTNLSAEARQAVRRQQILANDFKALAAAQLEFFSLEDVLPVIPMPCLFYAGELDPVYPEVVKYAKFAPNLTVVGFPGLSHTSAFWDSKAVVEQVVKFLQTAMQTDASTISSGLDVI